MDVGKGMWLPGAGDADASVAEAGDAQVADAAAGNAEACDGEARFCH